MLIYVIKKGFFRSGSIKIKIFFRRNHGPIPDIKEADYKITFKGILGNPKSFTLEDLKS